MSSIEWTNELEGKTVAHFKELIRINTSAPAGNETEAARYIAEVLRAEGIESTIVESEPGRGNLLAKLKGAKSQEPPILLISHLDVVPASEEDWMHPPFAAVEEEGWIYGRGALDTKNLVAMELMAFILLKRASTTKALNRDVYFIATADEEQGSRKGMEYLVREHPEWFPGGWVINEGGGFYLADGDKDYMLITAGEKGVCKATLLATGQGGHASCPPEGQAIEKLARAIEHITAHTFPEEAVGVGKRFLETMGESRMASDPTLQHLRHYVLRNSVTVNSVEVGQRINVIAYKAQAQIEFRLLPHVSQSAVEELLQKWCTAFGISYQIDSFEPGFESRLEDSALVTAFAFRLREHDPGVTLLPILALGRTDGRFLGTRGSDVYGFSPLLPQLPFADVLRKVHNHNEAITVSSLLFGTKLIAETLRQICLDS
ncbi:M20/M25/M40 family metallo-hydrolase [Brevibacillus invocatus]|uniref:M20/M25/M40 family metallo-hydrolase n=1 Tax=Brevibacillus invocatus TaxID=173959 RepID=A0A3M8BZ31_9BACL|nr:M20/M25/M40 family metallo-hydrolase [Brevibacillus invocatus]RNB68589.1 M20/M25/M40 family metallo-hydrolase [Brevibacillus invocatus]